MTLAPPSFAAFVGIDWADDHHDIALQAAATEPIEQVRIAHTPEELARWLASLATRFGSRPIAVALETSRAPLVYALREAPFVVLYPVNPRSLRRFRETFAPNGAKDDAPDARLLLTLLVKHRDQLRAWQPDDETTRALRYLVEQRRTVVDLRTQLTQQLIAALKDYFPQALVWAGDELTSAMACAFLRRWPTLAAVQRVRPATLERFFRHHRCRSAARIAERLTAIRTAQPLTRDAALIASRAPFVQLLAHQLDTLRPHLVALDAAIAARFAAHPDAALFAALPGAGAALAPRLLVAFGTDRTRFPSAVAIQEHTGIAPITIRSGRQCRVQWRHATSTFLRQTVHEFAHHSVRHCAWARACYAQLRARGKSHHAAVRALAFKWLRILWRCWQDRVSYDDARYERALALRLSPLSMHLSPQTAVPA